MDLFEVVAGIDLNTGEKIEPPVVEEPIPLPLSYADALNGSQKIYDESWMPKVVPTKTEKQNAAAHILLKDWNIDRSRPSSGNLDTDKNAHAAKVITDVTSLLEKHREELPEEEFKVLESDAVNKTVSYIDELKLDEEETFTNTQSMPFTGANMPLVSNAGFTFAVGNILRKMMATGPGSGITDLGKLDDIDDATLTEGYVLAYQPNVAPTNLPYKWQSPLTPPAGDINDVIAGAGLTGGGDSGAVTLNAGGTANRISISADAIDIASTYVGQTTITTLGTIGTGTWQGTAIANAYLGTGINANKIANGSVTSTEFQYINTLSSNAQTQLDSKPNKSFVTAIAVALG